MKRDRLRVLVDILLYLLIAFIFFIIILRGLPYPMIKSWPFVFVKLEGLLHTATVLFMLKLSMQNPPTLGRIFSFEVPDKQERNLPEEKNTVCSFAQRSNVLVVSSEKPKATAVYKGLDIFLSCAIFLFSLLYLLPQFNKKIPSYDEGQILAVTERICRGEIPQRDFFMLLSSGAHSIIGFMFNIFGSSVMVERILTLVLASAACSLFYLMARMGMNRIYSIGASLLFLAWQFPLWFHASYSWFAVFFSMFSFLILMIATRGNSIKKRGLFFLIGLLCGISFMSKQTTGAMSLIAVLVFFVVEKPVFGLEDNKVFSRNRHPEYRDLVLIGSGFLFPLILITSTYVKHRFVSGYLTGLLLDPLRLHAGFSAPYMKFSRFNDKRLMAYMPFLMMSVTAGVLFRKRQRGSLISRDRFTLILLLAAMFNLFTLFPRADFPHLVFTLWPTLLLLPYWMQQAALNGWNWMPQVLGGRYRNLIVVFFSLFIFAVFFVHRTESNLSFDRDLEELAGTRGKGIYGKPEKVAELNEVLLFMQDKFPGIPAGTLFSTHPLIYFLVGTQNPTPYDWILFGSVKEQYVDEIIGALERKGVNLVILDRAQEEYRVPPRWQEVRDYILQKYIAVFVSSQGRFTLLQRKSGSQSETMPSSV